MRSRRESVPAIPPATASPAAARRVGARKSLLPWAAQQSAPSRLDPKFRLRCCRPEFEGDPTLAPIRHGKADGKQFSAWRSGIGVVLLGAFTGVKRFHARDVDECNGALPPGTGTSGLAGLDTSRKRGAKIARLW
jgi:hypothetical protein